MTDFKRIINPRQTVLISTRSESEIIGKKSLKNNLIAVDWHTPLSFAPMMYGFAITKQRFSYELVHNSKVFVVNFMPTSLEKDVLLCGRRSGKHIDKFRETGLTVEEAEKIDCCKVKEAVATLECEVISEVETGDHVFFIGKVVHSELKKDTKRVFHIIDNEFTTTIK